MQIVRNAWSWPLPRTYGSFFLFLRISPGGGGWLGGATTHTQLACQPHPTDADLVAACDKRPWLILLIPEKSVTAKPSTLFATPTWQKLDDCGGGNQVLWHVCCLNCRIPTAPLSSWSIAFLLDNYTPHACKTQFSQPPPALPTTLFHRTQACVLRIVIMQISQRCTIAWLQQKIQASTASAASLQPHLIQSDKFAMTCVYITLASPALFSAAIADCYKICCRDEAYPHTPGI